MLYLQTDAHYYLHTNLHTPFISAIYLFIVRTFLTQRNGGDLCSISVQWTTVYATARLIPPTDDEHTHAG